MSEVYRYEFDENGVCYRKPDGPFVSHDDYAAIHYERIHDLNQIGGLQEELADLRSQFANSEQENARLKAEVERLRKAGDAMAVMVGHKEVTGDAHRMMLELSKEWNAAQEGKPSV